MKKCPLNCFEDERKNTLKNVGYFIGWFIVNFCGIKNQFLQYIKYDCRYQKKIDCGDCAYFIYPLLRALGILTLAIVISEEPRTVDTNFNVALYVLLAYAFISLSGNFLLIVGISKENPYYFLPYLGIHGIELFVGVIILTGGIIFVVKLETSLTALSYIIPTGIISLGVYGLFWYLLLHLFRYNEDLYMEQKSERSIKNYLLLSKLCHCNMVSRSASINISL